MAPAAAFICVFQASCKSVSLFTSVSMIRGVKPGANSKFGTFRNHSSRNTVSSIRTR
jgi:hypothetical protein